MDMNYRGGMWEGEDGQDGVKEGKWDNCNSIINKYIFKKLILKKLINFLKIVLPCLPSNATQRSLEKLLFFLHVFCFEF